MLAADQSCIRCRQQWLGPDCDLVHYGAAATLALELAFGLDGPALATGFPKRVSPLSGPKA